MSVRVTAGPSFAAAPLLPQRHGVGPSCVALPDGPWLTVLDFLVARFPKVGPRVWQERLRAGLVLTANGECLSEGAPYRAQTKLYYYRHVPDEAPIPFEARVIYRDAHLVVADKPHFLPVTPGGRYVSETLLVRLKQSLGIDTLSPIHRLDRETAGVVLFSVRAQDRDRYHAMFRQRCVDKVYEAIAPAVDALAGPQWRRSRLEPARSFMQMHEVAGPPNAASFIERLAIQGDWARYRLRPETGQRHQLRVHMAALGAPLYGDRIYPVLQPEERTPDYTEPLRLLAKQVAFTDPVTGAARCFESEQHLSWPDNSPERAQR